MKKLILAFAAIAAMASCSKETETIESPAVGDQAASFFSQISSRVVADTLWSEGDQIGVYQILTGNTDLANYASYSNVSYTSTAADSSEVAAFEVTTAGKDIYFPLNEETQVDFYAYYPYSASSGSGGIYSLSIQAQDRSSIDLLVASTKGCSAVSSTEVGFEFSHALSKLQINLIAGSGIESSDLADMRITVSGMPTRASYNLATNEITGQTSKQDMSFAEIVNGESYDVMLIPGTVELNSYITLTFKNNDKAVIDTDFENVVLEAGKVFVFDVTIEKVDSELTTGTINGWSGDSLGSGVAGQ